MASLICYFVRRTLIRSGSTLSRNFSSSNSSSLADLLLPLKECHNIIVMAGAGLSTPSGIPDFRSPDTGLYYSLEQYNLPYPEAIFDLRYFAQNPLPFLRLAKELYPGLNYKPNLGHYFIRLLHKKKKLLRMYTQNIDGLERLSGLPGNKLVEAHGSFSTASCIKCSKSQDPEKTKTAILNGEVVKCFNEACQGLVKPDIVFFGEQLPERFFLYHEDTLITDYLIVIGTSLEVYPFAGIADAIPDTTPRLLINWEKVGTLGMRSKDALLDGDIIKSINDLVTILGWEKELAEQYDTST